MKQLLFFVLFMSSIAYGQSYSPALHTVTNKALGIAQANPTDARSYYYDASLFKYRAYQSTSEVNAYLNLSKYRTGQFSIILNVGGTLNPDGTYSGGSYVEYWYKDGTADIDLVVKSAVSPSDTAAWNTAYRKRPTSLVYDSATSIVTLTLGDGSTLSDTLSSEAGVVFTNGSFTVGDTLLVANPAGDTAWVKNILGGSSILVVPMGDTVLKLNIDSSTVPNIYNSDGTINSYRTVSLANGIEISGALTDSGVTVFALVNDRVYFTKKKVSNDLTSGIIAYMNELTGTNPNLSILAAGGLYIGDHDTGDTTTKIYSWNQDNIIPYYGVSDTLMYWNPSTGQVMRAKVSSGSTETASNGLNKVVNDIKLGGTLTENTTITHSTFSLTHTGDLLVANTVKVGKGRNANTGNTAIGQAALDSITTGVTNTGIGYQALQNNKTGNDNTAVGVNTLQQNTTGSTNTALGRSALGGNTTGLGNTGNGEYTLLANTTGSRNTAVGYSAGDGPITGSNNIYLGYYSGRWYATTSTINTTPNQSIFIGDSTKAAADNQTNQIVIGHNAVGAGSNTATIGKGLVATYTTGKIRNDTLAGTGSRYVVADANGDLTATLTVPLSASATLDFPSTSGGAASDLTITVTGAADGDIVAIGVPNGSVPGTSGYFAWVSAADTVTIRFANQSGSPTDPASGTFKVRVFK